MPELDEAATLGVLILQRLLKKKVLLEWNQDHQCYVSTARCEDVERNNTSEMRTANRLNRIGLLEALGWITCGLGYFAFWAYEPAQYEEW